MDFAIKFAFDVAAFTSVMVLIVLGLGVIASMMGIFNFAHGELVLLGAYTVYLSDAAGLGTWAGLLAAPFVVGTGRAGAGTHHHPPLLPDPDHRHARHLCDRADHPRDRARPARRPLQVDPRADAAAPSRVGGLEFSGWRSFIIVTTLVVIAGSTGCC